MSIPRRRSWPNGVGLWASGAFFVFLRTNCASAQNPPSEVGRMCPLANLGGTEEIMAAPRQGTPDQGEAVFSQGRSKRFRKSLLVTVVVTFRRRSPTMIVR